MIELYIKQYTELFINYSNSETKLLENNPRGIFNCKKFTFILIFC